MRGLTASTHKNESFRAVHQKHIRGFKHDALSLSYYLDRGKLSGYR